MKLAHLMAALIFTTSIATAQVQGIELDEPVPMPAFLLTDENGEEFFSEDLEGQWTLIMFGFLTCPDVCPFTLGNLEAVIAESSMRVLPKNVPKVIFVSVDPDRDADYISNYAQFFHPDFRSYTGMRDQIDLMIEATDSFYRLMPPDQDGHYDVQHSSSVAVVAPDGTLRAKLQPPFDPGLTSEFLTQLQIQYRKGLTQ